MNTPKFSVVMSHTGEGLSIYEEDFEQRHQTGRFARLHAEEHNRIRRRLDVEGDCPALFELRPYRETPLASIIDYTGNCPDDCCHMECGEDETPADP